jgi:hypothetical protein
MAKRNQSNPFKWTCLPSVKIDGRFGVVVVRVAARLETIVSGAKSKQLQVEVTTLA